MRHRKKGRRLGRSASHRKAMFRNLASSLFLTERDAEADDGAPKVLGRVVTTIHKAKEVRPLVEKCVTIARRSLVHEEAAREYATDAERGSDAWRSWRQSENWKKWNAAMAPALAARRRALQLLGDKKAVRVLFDDIAPRFVDRNGGYTRVMRLAKPRLGDGGTRAILEFVGVRDRVVQHSERPAFEDEAPEESSAAPVEKSAVDVAEQTSVASETDEAASNESSSPEAQAESDESK